METPPDLLKTTPANQVTRCQIAHCAIVDGRWRDAAFSLRHAADEERGDWGAAARELAAYCDREAT